MAALNAYASYQQSQVTTADPGRLLLMVYDGALRFLAEGKRAMGEGRYEVQGACLTKAQSLLMELIVTLDHSVIPEMSTALERLYRYMYDRLTHANVHDDARALDEVIDMMRDLRQTWAEADAKVRLEKPVASRGELI